MPVQQRGPWVLHPWAYSFCPTIPSYIGHLLTSSSPSSYRGLPHALVEAPCCRVVQCYCPYTRCASGVAIITAGGQLFSGGYLESAAFNPSLPPFQAAVVSAVTGGMPAYDQVRPARL